MFFGLLNIPLYLCWNLRGISLLFLIGVSRFAKKVFFIFLIRMFKNATDIASIAHPTHLANALKMLMWILLKTC